MGLFGDILGVVGVVGAPFTGGASLELTGAALSANASEKASQQQQQAAQQGLDLNKAAFNPYMQAGQTALGRAGAISQQPGWSTPFQPGARPNYGTVLGQQAQGLAQAQGPAPGSLVSIQAPDGEVRQVPPALVQQFLAKGATLVGAGMTRGGPEQ